MIHSDLGSTGSVFMHDKILSKCARLKKCLPSNQSRQQGFWKVPQILQQVLGGCLKGGLQWGQFLEGFLEEVSRRMMTPSRIPF